MQYGILIGRFQPLHAGHQSIINEIMHDGLIPVVLIGSSTTIDDNNPLTYVERSSLIHQIYGGSVITLPLVDSDSDEQWATNVYDTLWEAGVYRSQAYVYYWYKEGDKDLEELFEEYNYGYMYKLPTCPDIYEGLSATKIRNDPDKYKKYLDGRVYHKIKGGK